MKNLNRLIVSLCFEKKGIDVGELVNDGRKIYFKYYPSFLKKQLQISSFKLPNSSEILTADTTIFDGLFGVFNDSLPDGWGRLLVDRTLVSRGVSLSEIRPLQRLSIVGKTGAGALTYRPAEVADFELENLLELDAIAGESRKIIEGTSSDVIEQLFHLGGSSGGARPKIFVGWNPKTNRLISSGENLPEGYEHWIIKFSSAIDPPDIAQIEFAYHKMAIAAGLEMSECRLFEGASGKQYFGTKRFDRKNQSRLHLHSAAGLMHDNFRLSNMDYGHVADAAFRLEKSVLAYEKVLRIAAFNVFSHNRDDHSKNISFLMDSAGNWRLAPAYDLTFSFSSHGYHSLSVAGESQNPGTKKLIAFGEIFGIKNAPEIISEVKETVRNWKKIASESGVKNASAKSINKVLETIE